ncbi:uncharacterized protein LOC127279591 [Leptopilina boulardi]|uniref:uncharacterized protein LOC127279591 n=1 Tax=Leptopilina boulardi TaxID=63433 RepID=UPI0021F558C4|nr:uncharacterized protein LOC127279591 [Leptopilina boulardi]
MDSRTRRDWEQELRGEDKIPTYDEVESFLQRKVWALKTTESSKGEHGARVMAVSTSKGTCSLCGDQHYLGHCADLKTQYPEQRKKVVTQLKLCFNCLRSGHMVRECLSKSRCQECKAPHHTLLHQPTTLKRPTEDTPRPTGSEASFASSILIRRLGLMQRVTNVPISTIGGCQIETVRGSVTLHLHSRQASASLEVQALVLRSLPITTPPQKVVKPEFAHLKRVALADPDFTTSQGIEILLGADVYGSLLLDGLRRGPCGTPIAQQTIFGWVVMGSETQSLIKYVSALTTNPLDDLSNNLERFWNQEEVSAQPVLSREDQDCVQLFQKGVRRDNSGKYRVRLPVRSSCSSQLGESLSTARSILKSTLFRMDKDPKLAKEYARFIQEYERLGHMRPVSPSSIVPHDPPPYYIAHHGIWRNADGKPKLRVVFNASRPSTTGLSANQLLHTRPKLQINLATILMRWRFFRVVFVADIEMMYRMILIDERDVDLQRIVWKRPEDDKVTHFQLLTLTYGMSCSPYLALRTMQQLATDEEASFPDAARIIRKNTHVDDVFSGADDEASAAQLKSQLISMLLTAGFHLKKWISNHPPLLYEIPECDRLHPHWRHFETGGPTNALGVAWNPVRDEFRFQPATLEFKKEITKRNVLSAIARLFDPVGWLSPILIVAKVIMQDLWRAKLGWDESLPDALSQRWITFKSQISSVSMNDE